MNVVPKHKLNKFGGVYTTEIRDEPRKPVKNRLKNQINAKTKRKLASETRINQANKRKS